jgi:hypothetical protein
MYLYLVSNPYMQSDLVKVGYMSSAPSQIIKRYKTYYGTETTAMCWVCSDAQTLEKDFKDQFGYSRVELELYSAKYVMRYINWLTETSGVTPYVCTGTTFPPTSGDPVAACDSGEKKEFPLKRSHAMFTRQQTKSGRSGL